MIRPHGRGWRGAALLLLHGTAGAAPSISEAQLPPPAAQAIDFARDIQPILAENCLRCHGPERPRGGLRLTDRASALRGGADGIDIFPGDSARSPLVHYVARLVPDQEMPPEGKGRPLSTREISLLRAWIDQSAPWDAGTNGVTSASASATAAAGFIKVRGDAAKFRELEGVREGGAGGVRDFDLRRRLPDGRSTEVSGHLLRDDYKVELTVRKPDLGYAQFGFEQYRKYFDNAGGYAPTLSPALHRLDSSPALDVGRAWAEGGLELPNGPRITLRYEFQYRNGAQSTLNWGSAPASAGNFQDTRNIYPSLQTVDERTHVVRLEAGWEKRGFDLENDLRLEFQSAGSSRAEGSISTSGLAKPDQLVHVGEQRSHTLATDAVSVQKQLADGWIAGVGYRYAWMDGSTALQIQQQDGAGRPAAGMAWTADTILLNEVSQVFNAFTQLRPWTNLTATVGVQGEWRRQNNLGDVNLDLLLDPNDPTGGIERFPATERSILDDSGAEESLVARYTGLPWTTLYAEGRLKQESWVQTVDQVGGTDPVALEEDARVRRVEERFGFTLSPRSWATLGASFQHRDRRTDYSYPRAESQTVYPGFIRSRAIVSDELQPRLTLHPARWMKAVLTYQRPVSDFRTTTGPDTPTIAGDGATPGGAIVAGRYRSHGVNASASFTASARLSFSAAAGYQRSTTITDSHDASAAAPYRGDLWSGMLGASWVIDDRTDATLHYLLSRARFGRHDDGSSLQLGLDYDRHGVQAALARRFGKHITGRLEYGYFAYAEPSSGHLRDYTAHQVLAVVRYAWP